MEAYNGKELFKDASNKNAVSKDFMFLLSEMLRERGLSDIINDDETWTSSESEKSGVHCKFVLRFKHSAKKRYDLDNDASGYAFRPNGVFYPHDSRKRWDKSNLTVDGLTCALIVDGDKFDGYIAPIGSIKFYHCRNCGLLSTEVDHPRLGIKRREDGTPYRTSDFGSFIENLSKWMDEFSSTFKQ